MNNFADILKAQLLFNQKENMLYSMIILSLFEMFTGFFREFFTFAKKWGGEWLRTKFQKKVSHMTETITASVAELTFERIYGKTDNWDAADSILSHILKIPEAQTVLVIGQLEVVKNRREFPITDKINFELQNIKVDEKGTLEQVKFRIFSKDLTICQLRDFVENLVDDYLIIKKNNLGNKRFYFDQVVEKVHPRMKSIPKKVVFTKHVFETNRTLDNVYHERQAELKHRVQFFLNRKEWYDQRGIPHTLGLLMYGEPGTGKTSSIKAIANVADRHIININLSNIKTKKQLKKLFYDERIEVCENSENINNTTEYIIPIDKRLFVIEDIDAVDTDLVRRRNQNTTISFMPEEEDMGDLDLSTILNIIDGTLETPGRILIISSNYPEVLDPALIRPGRIDMLIEYKKCNRNVVRDMYRSFYNEEPTDLEKVDEYKWSPAEVGQLLFKNFGDPDGAMRDLIELDPKEYFKFSYMPEDEPIETVEEVVENEPEPETVDEVVENEPEPETVEEVVENEPEPDVIEEIKLEKQPAVEVVTEQPEVENDVVKAMNESRNRFMMDFAHNGEIQKLMENSPAFGAKVELYDINAGLQMSDTGYAFAGL